MDIDFQIDPGRIRKLLDQGIEVGGVWHPGKGIKQGRVFGYRQVKPCSIGMVFIKYRDFTQAVIKLMRIIYKISNGEFQDSSILVVQDGADISVLFYL